MNYYGIYRSPKNGSLAWRKASYYDDVVALSNMKTLSLKKEITNEDGELKEKMVHYDLDYLTCEKGKGNRVVYNG